MSNYLGYIEIKNSFYNYFPIAIFENGKIRQLTSDEVSEIIPLSSKRNINLEYSLWDKESSQRMQKWFPNHSLFLFKLDSTDELKDNLNNNGERNPTGYKISAEEAIGAGIIRPIEKENIFHALPNKCIKSNFLSDRVIDINVDYIPEQEHVYVEIEELWAGPYSLNAYREDGSNHYITPNIPEKKYTVSGYDPDDVAVYDLFDSDPKHYSTEGLIWKVLVPKPKSAESILDVISDQKLIETFTESLKDNGSISIDGSIKIEDVQKIVEKYNSSYLAGNNIPKEIAESRVERLKVIFESEENIDNALGSISNVICEILSKYKNNSSVENWVNDLLDHNPGFVEKLSGTKKAEQIINGMKSEIDMLRKEKEKLDEEIIYKKKSQEEINDVAVEQVKQEIQKKNDEYNDLCKQIEALRSSMPDLKEAKNITDNLNKLRSEESYQKRHHEELKNQVDKLETEFNIIVRDLHDKITDIAFDGYISSKMLQAASEWENSEKEKTHKGIVDAINSIQPDIMSEEELVDYICSQVQLVRPSYDRNAILNVFTCIFQGFITVFSGEPGCGKTSMCTIVAEILGLNSISSRIDRSYSNENLNRFISVSVERGWTSKRDFIGYYNPLSKSFDKSNSLVFDSLHKASTEAKEQYNKFPMLVLLDEANLSPMEYYWSDFMNVCDNLSSNNTINLGENYLLSVPETLHFVATINNDHTTETLSPRLIDRSWIITLPSSSQGTPLDINLIRQGQKLIDWNLLKKVFCGLNNEPIMSADATKVYTRILQLMRKQRFTISPRVDYAIKKYCGVTSKLFTEDETKSTPDMVALDYAVSQRILPKIVGSGDDFEKWLEELKNVCSEEGLSITAKRVRDIIESGNQRMKYYQFF